MLLAALLLAQTAPQCATTDVGLPVSLTGWTAEGGTPGDMTVGKAIWLRTISSMVTNMDKIYEPGEALPGHAEYGFGIEAAGVYGIALDNPGWIDAVSDVPGAEPLEAVKHGHGPACSTIRKIVWFDLQPGRYRLRLSKLTVGMSKVMLVAPE